MRTTKVFCSMLAVAVLAACGGQSNQTAGGAEPASSQPQAGTTPQAQQEQAPAPVQEAPAATPAPEPAAPPAQSPPRQAVKQPAAKPAPVTAPAVAETPPATIEQPASPAMATVPAGTILTLTLDQELNSKTSMVGDVFTATVIEGVSSEGRALIPPGAKIQGTVTEAEPAKRGAGNAKLAVTFDLLQLDDGYRTNIVGSIQEVSESKKKRNAQVIGGSAAAGALLGRIVGKDTKGAVIGGIIGGGIGTAVVLGKEGEQAVMSTEMPLTIRLEEPVQVPEK